MKPDLSLRTVTVMRYILPLREGGSLPALAEADDDFKYVLKFGGGGHGTKMLVSELLGGKIAQIGHGKQRLIAGGQQLAPVIVGDARHKE